MKNGMFCIYKGNEYEVNKDMKCNYVLITKDEKIIDSDFIDKYQSGTYSKVVNLSELNKCYKIITKGIINEESVNIEKENDLYYFVGTSNSDIARDLGLNRTDKYYYNDWIPKEKVKIIEEIEKFNF